MGVHRNEFLVLKIIFILYINGGAQEGKHNFFSVIKLYTRMENLSYKNTISIMCLNFYFSEECDLNGVLGCGVGAGW